MTRKDSMKILALIALLALAGTTHADGIHVQAENITAQLAVGRLVVVIEEGAYGPGSCLTCPTSATPYYCFGNTFTDDSCEVGTFQSQGAFLACSALAGHVWRVTEQISDYCYTLERCD